MPRLTAADFRTLDEMVDEMAAAAGDGAEAYAHSVEMNVAFHRYLVERAGHDLLLKAWLAVNPLNWRFVTYKRLLNPGPVELAERHRALITAYRSGDQVLAAAVLRQHIWEVAERVLATMPEDAPPDGPPLRQRALAGPGGARGGPPPHAGDGRAALPGRVSGENGIATS
jgi:DNA-binding GntR family transcriptional regulator